MEGDYDDLLAQLFPGMPISKPIEPYNFKQYLERRIHSLTALEAITCRLRFGLFDGKNHLPEELAGMMNLSAGQVAAILNRAIKKMRKIPHN